MTEQEMLARIEALEKEVKRQAYYTDMQEIQALMARYIYYLEMDMGQDRVYDDLFSHTDPDVRVEIMDSGAYIGQEHVKRAMYTMGRRVDKKGNPIPEGGAGVADSSVDRANPLLTITISTPYVVVSEDGTHAWGQWHLFGPHSNRVFNPETGVKQETAFWMVGKYDNEFVKEDGVWKFQKLRPICWLRTPYNKSWLEVPDCRRTPSPYYPPDEPRRVSSYCPDEPRDPDKWGPAPHEWINHNV